MTLYSPRYPVNVTLNLLFIKNEMAVSRFSQVSDEEISEMKINAAPKSAQNATKYSVKLFKGNPL